MRSIIERLRRRAHRPVTRFDVCLELCLEEITHELTARPDQLR